MEFFHCGDDICNVLDDVLAADLIERIVAKRQAAAIEIAEDVRGRGRIHVQTDRTRIFCRAAADIENARQAVLPPRLKCLAIICNALSSVTQNKCVVPLAFGEPEEIGELR
jgi:hypothetical protein